MTSMLNIKDLRAYYGQIQALHGVSLSIREGEVTTLLGATAPARPRRCARSAA